MALNYDAIMAYRPPEIPVTYGPRDCMIYALGIGLGMDPLDAGQLRFVCERDLAAFPTLPTQLGWMPRLTDPAFGIDDRRVVLSDQKLVLHRPLAAAAQLVSRPRIREVVDRGPGGHAIIQFSRELVDADGTPVATIESSTLARNQGGFGGRVTALPPPAAVPERPPDLTCDLPTPPNLALLFQLNGDDNPLHIDPARARAAGFPRPILHGLASFGIAAHAILRGVADYQPERLAQIEARFARPVYPGETLRTELWRTGDDVAFQCRVVERDELTVTHGRAVLR